MHPTIRHSRAAFLLATVALIACAVCLSAADSAQSLYTLESLAPTRDYQAIDGDWLLSWDGSRRAPRWTLERLTPASLGNVPRAGQFRHAPDEQPEFAASPDDYNGFTAHYDRGHCAAAANHNDTPAHLHETFNIQNAMVQRKVLNEQLWRHLEDYVRSLTARGTIVWIVTLPVWTPEGYPDSLDSREACFATHSIGLNHQQIPPHCGKSIMVQRGATIEIKSWLVPNDDSVEGKLYDQYAISTDRLESLAGLNLWPALPDALQAKLERE